MKKKVLLLALLIVTVFSTVAMADEEIKTPVGYLRYDGKITQTSESKQILLENKDSKTDDKIIFNTQGALVVDANNGELVDNHSFKKGEDVAVFIKSNTPMAMSLPPQANAGVIVLNARTVQNSFDVDYFDMSGEGISHRSKIGVLPESAKYVDLKERNVKRTALFGNDLIVFYKKATRSIPPIVTPEKIFYLVKEEKEVVKIPENIFKENKPSKNMYKLRDLFTSLGCEVKYEADTKRIKIQKGDMLAYIALYDNTAIVNAEAFKVDFKANKGVSYITKDSANMIWEKMNKFNITEKEPEYLEK